MNPSLLKIIIVILLLSISIVLVLDDDSWCSKDNFCTCQGMGNKVCPNTKLLKDLYNSGKLTEYSDFAKMQGTPKWRQ